MYWSASRSTGGLIGACSISNATPSKGELARAVAVSMSGEAKPTKAVLPCSRALMTPFRRGISGMACLLSRSRQLGLQAAVDPARVALEDLAPVLVAEPERLDVALGVVEVVPGLRVDAPDRADHLGGEQNIVDRDDLEQEIDPGLMIDAGVEEDVVQQMILQERLLQILGDPPVAPPVVWNRPAPMRDYELQARKVLEEVGGDELHERRGVAVDVVAAGGVEVRIARQADVDHRRDVELHELLIERIPPLVGQWRILPVPPDGSGFRLQPMKPSSFMQRSTSAMELVGGT